MIVCTQCGRHNEDGTQFCTQCSAFLEWSGQREIPAAETPTSGAGVGAGGRAALATSVSSTDLFVEPGGEVDCEIEVRNRGAIVDQVSVQVFGEPGGWALANPVAINLLPDDEGTARVSFRPPRTSQVQAGPRVFQIRATSTVDPSCIGVQEGVITVGAFYELSGELSPKDAAARLSTQHSVTLYNAGNAPVAVGLACQDIGRTLALSITPAVLTLQAGQQGSAIVRARPLQGRWIGEEQRGAFHVVTACEQVPPIQLDAQVSYRPFFKGVRRGHLILLRILLTILGAGALVRGAFGEWVSGQPGMRWTYPEYADQVLNMSLQAPRALPRGAIALGLVPIAFAILVSLGLIGRTGGLTRVFGALALLVFVPFFVVTSSRLSSGLGVGAILVLIGSVAALAGGMLGLVSRE